MFYNPDRLYGDIKKYRLMDLFNRQDLQKGISLLKKGYEE